MLTPRPTLARSCVLATHSSVHNSRDGCPTYAAPHISYMKIYNSSPPGEVRVRERASALLGVAGHRMVLHRLLHCGSPTYYLISLPHDFDGENRWQSPVDVPGRIFEKEWRAWR